MARWHAVLAFVGLAASAAVANALRLIFGGDSHRNVTYFVSYGIAVVFVVALVGLTAFINRERVPKATPTNLLTVALSEGLRLRDLLAEQNRPAHWTSDGTLVDGITVPPSIRDDPLYQWASKTLNLLRAHFPAYADRFYGDEAPTHARDWFVLAYAIEVERDGRRAFLERRIALLKRLGSVV